MHSSRMHTVRCSGRLGGFVRPGVCVRGCASGGGCLPRKEFTTTVVDGKNGKKNTGKVREFC